MLPLDRREHLNFGRLAQLVEHLVYTKLLYLDYVELIRV